MNGMPKPAPYRGIPGHHRRMGNPGNRADVRQDIPVVGGDLGGILRSRIGHRQRERQHVICPDAEVHPGEVPEAVNRQARAGQQRQRQPELPDDQNTAQPMLSHARSGAAALLERFAGIDTRGIPCRRAACQQPGQRGCAQREEKDRNVEPQIGLIG